jgi:carbamoyl-phosphate synthase small subunit
VSESPSPALLALADGSFFSGHSIGAAGLAVGEVVFNTAITGYQEILTDPSYCEQIVTLTYPHIGSTGVNAEDEESARPYAAGLVIRDLPLRASSWRAERTLPEYLQAHGVVAIAGIDTRRLTRILREKGAQAGCVMAGRVSAEEALAQARAFPGLAGMDLAKVVTAERPYEWTEGTWRLGKGFAKLDRPRFRVAAYDYGVKRNILRMLVDLSNGPGDPEPCEYAIEAIGRILDTTRIPVFGICLGHQLMGLASGARTMKMKFGHHGANHPVKDLDTGKVVITSQNHGFAVDPATLPPTLRPTHVSLFDGSLQGLARTDRPAFCFQGHPEASPGPHDVGYLFDRFVGLMEGRRA